VDVPVRVDDTYDCCDWQTFTLTVTPVKTIQPNKGPQSEPIGYGAKNTGMPDYGQYPDVAGQFSDVAGQFSEFYNNAFGKGISAITGSSADYGAHQPIKQAAPSHEPFTQDLLGSQFSTGSLWSHEELKKREMAEQWLGLAEFLSQYGDGHLSKDKGDFGLNFNAGQINLLEWLDQLSAMYHEPDANPVEVAKRAEIDSFTAPIKEALVFSPDDIRISDYLGPKSAAMANGGAQNGSEFDNGMTQSRSFNMDEVSLDMIIHPA
jgi:hypothetical protein